VHMCAYGVQDRVCVNICVKGVWARLVGVYLGVIPMRTRISV